MVNMKQLKREKIFHTNGDSKRTDEIDLESKIIKRDKEHYND